MNAATMEATKIQAGQTITARSIGDAGCIFGAKVVSRSGSFAVCEFDGQTKRTKIYLRDGIEYVMPYGRYSMAPMFHAA